MDSRVKHNRESTLKLRILKMRMCYAQTLLNTHTYTYPKASPQEKLLAPRQRADKTATNKRKKTKGKGGRLGSGFRNMLLDLTKEGSTML